MTKEQHKRRHMELHKILDELTADAFEHSGLSRKSTILDLMKWSFKQTWKPDHNA